jgi:hypothetical protein
MLMDLWLEKLKSVTSTVKSVTDKKHNSLDAISESTRDILSSLSRRLKTEMVQNNETDDENVRENEDKNFDSRLHVENVNSMTEDSNQTQSESMGRNERNNIEFTSRTIGAQQQIINDNSTALAVEETSSSMPRIDESSYDTLTGIYDDSRKLPSNTQASLSSTSVSRSRERRSSGLSGTELMLAGARRFLAAQEAAAIASTNDAASTEDADWQSIFQNLNSEKAKDIDLDNKLFARILAHNKSNVVLQPKKSNLKRKVEDTNSSDFNKRMKLNVKWADENSTDKPFQEVFTFEVERIKSTIANYKSHKDLVKKERQLEKDLNVHKVGVNELNQQ